MIFNNSILDIAYYVPSSGSDRLFAQMFYQDRNCELGEICNSDLCIDVLQSVYISPKVLELSSFRTEEFLRLVGLETREDNPPVKWITAPFLVLGFYEINKDNAGYIKSIDYLLHNTEYEIDNYKLKGIKINLDYENVLYKYGIEYHAFLYALYLYFAVVSNYILSGYIYFNVVSEIAEYNGPGIENHSKFVYRNGGISFFQESRGFLYKPTVKLQGCIDGVRHSIETHDLSNRF